MRMKSFGLHAFHIREEIHMVDVKLNDDRFERGTGWIEFFKDNRFIQRYMVEGGAFFSETMMTVRSSKDAALTVLQNPWIWWQNGKVLQFQRNSDMSCDLELKPIYWAATRVMHHIFPPVPLSDKEGSRLIAILSHHFEGPATFDVYSSPGSGESIVVRGRFHGIKNKLPIPFATTTMAAKIHLGAESGTLKFPFPKGTGWVGLYRHLEGDKVHSELFPEAPQKTK
jgi:hypothetical protein